MSLAKIHANLVIWVASAFNVILRKIYVWAVNWDIVLEIMGINI